MRNKYLPCYEAPFCEIDVCKVQRNGRKRQKLSTNFAMDLNTEQVPA